MRHYDQIVIAILVVFTTVGLVMLGDYGVTTDESLRMLASRAWWKAITEGSVDAHVEGTKANYGVLFDQLGRVVALVDRHALGGTDPFRGRHALCLMTATLGLGGTYLLGRRLSSPAVACTAVVLLVFTPRFDGSAFANPKDIPFLTAVVWAMLSLVRAVQHPSRRSTWLAALACGLCTTVRPLGAVFFVLGAVAIMVPVVRWDGRYPWSAMAPARRRAIVQVLSFLVLAYAIVYATWPVLWVRGPWHLLDASTALTRHIRGSRSLLLGELHPFGDAPGHYVLVWLGVTLPLAVLIPGVLGLFERAWAVWKASQTSLRPALPWLLVIGWVLGPTLYPMFTRVTLYDTSRQFLFVAPAMALLAAHTIGLAWRSIQRRRAVLITVIGLCVGEAAVRMVTLHPYQNIYFNPLAGGLAGAHGRFDVAHYSETYAEGFAWLADHASAPVHVHVFGNGSTTASFLAHRHGISLNTPTFGYFLSEVRQGWETHLPGKVVHRIEREGVPLLEIRKVDPMTATPRGYLYRASDPSTGWQPLEAQRGQFVVEELLEPKEQAWLAIPLQASGRATARVYASFYWGATISLLDADGTQTLLYDEREVPFHYRATEYFPSLVPLDVPLIPGTQWLVIDLRRIRPDWHVGVYAPATTSMSWGTEPPPPTIHIASPL